MINVYIEHFGEALVIKQNERSLEISTEDAKILLKKLAALLGFKLVQPQAETPKQALPPAVEPEEDVVEEEGEEPAPAEEVEAEDPIPEPAPKKLVKKAPVNEDDVPPVERDRPAAALLKRLQFRK